MNGFQMFLFSLTSISCKLILTPEPRFSTVPLRIVLTLRIDAIESMGEFGFVKDFMVLYEIDLIEPILES